ncbi:hypothetical protein [Catenuloplanes japonicus]|uniref:hypothetical protein n=1 Tax=Catenuloplanes japonicus TaxID=33876 RepID=UPI000691E0BD|nr:hypothetical protein [Catenuloplanes japonicus]
MNEMTPGIGTDAELWRTASPERTVLAVVHTVATLRSVLDAVELLETDPRIQTTFVLAPDVLTGGRRTELRRLDGLVVTWEQATRTMFDLVIAADSGHLYELKGPILKLPHGAMNNRIVPASVGDPASGFVVGLSRPWLTHYGRVVPASVAVTHEAALRTLEAQCPEACSRAVLTGDLCLDRLTASGPDRAVYRAALGVRDDRPVVAISSTWGPDSLYARAWPMISDLIRSLDGAHTRAVLHPAAWYTHGPRQIAAWADGRAGMACAGFPRPVGVDSSWLRTW